MKRTLVRAWLMTVIGTGLLLWGLYGLVTSGDVRCGGQSMTAGDTSQECVHYGEGKRLGYDEQKSDNIKHSLMAGGLGLLALGVGGYRFVEVSRRRSEWSASPAEVR